MKRIVMAATAAMMIMFCFLMSGCLEVNLSPVKEKIEGEVWTYYIMYDDTVALIGLNEKAIPKDGVLYIPNEVDGRKVSMLGIYKNMFFGDKPFSVPYMQRITVAEGVPISSEFWRANLSRITEFESTTANEIKFYELLFGGISENSMRNIIVPQNSRKEYISKIEGQKEKLSSRYIIAEKSELIDDAWFVDEDGLLLGYYGTDPDNYVLPNGIKKIGTRSFIKGTDKPKTITLNDDLEEIEGGGVNFRSSNILDEVWIPVSVRYIGWNGVLAHKVYLYRITELHERAFDFENTLGFVAEVIYLD